MEKAQARLTSVGRSGRADRSLSTEIAFSEYAVGLGYEILKQDPHISADDLLYEVRSSLNRGAASAAALYR